MQWNVIDQDYDIWVCPEKVYPRIGGIKFCHSDGVYSLFGQNGCICGVLQSKQKGQAEHTHSHGSNLPNVKNMCLTILRYLQSAPSTWIDPISLIGRCPSPKPVRRSGQQQSALGAGDSLLSQLPNNDQDLPARQNMFLRGIFSHTWFLYVYAGLM